MIPLAPHDKIYASLMKVICRGNLSVRSLADIVSEDDLLQDSEYMQSILVAIPKYPQCSQVIVRKTNGDLSGTSSRLGIPVTKTWPPWWSRGPQCASPIPFRVHLALNCVSLCHSSLASDDDYTLFTVIIFRKVYDAFVQKCRENKCEICRRIITLAFSPPY